MGHRPTVLKGERVCKAMSRLKNLSQTAKQLMVSTLAVCAVFFAAAAFFRDDIVRLALGVLLGWTCCCVRIFMMERSINKMLDMCGKASIYANAQFLARYAVAAVTLIAAALLPGIFDIVGAVLGVISIQLGAYAVKLIFKDKDLGGAAPKPPQGAPPLDPNV